MVVVVAVSEELGNSVGSKMDHLHLDKLCKESVRDQHIAGGSSHYRYVLSQ